MKTYYGYTRVSTTKQGEGVSLTAQTEAIANYAHKHDLNISQWFEETETAASTGRPVFNRMVKLLSTGKVDGVIIHKIDRSARNFRDWAHIGELSDQGVEIHFVTETLDFQSRGGRLSADIQAVIAADYVRNLREETVKGLTGRLKQGLYPFKAPVGYLDTGGGQAKAPDPALAPLVIEAFHLYATGRYSLTSLRMEMTILGLCDVPGRRLHVTALSRMLSNPFYTGTIRIQKGGNEYPGVHQPLIDKKLFDQVQRVLRDRSKKITTRHEHLYRGIFTCGLCGSTMTPEAQKQWVYYRCHKKTCSMKTVREDNINEVVRELIFELSQETEMWSQIRNLLKDWHSRRPRVANRQNALLFQLGNIEERIRRTTDALVDNRLVQSQFESRMTDLQHQQTRLKTALEATKHTRSPKQAFDDFLISLGHFDLLYETLTKSEKRDFLEIYTTTRVLYPERILIRKTTSSDGLERVSYLMGRVFHRITQTKCIE